MRATLRRYWCGVILLTLLPFPGELASTHASIAASGPALPFLTSVSAQLRGVRMLTSLSATVSSAYSTLSPTAAASEALPATKRVVVLQGQSLWNIAVANGMAVDSLVKANALRNAALIQPGQTLMIPSAAAPPVAPRVMPPAAVSPQAVPAATPKAQPAVTTPLVVTVQDGQSLWVLASQYGTSVDAIVAANNLVNASFVRAGQRLVIPGKGAVALKPASKSMRPTTVVVQGGQTLWSLARAYGVSVDDIVAANGLRSAEYIRAGMRLAIPGRQAVAAAGRRSPVPGSVRSRITSSPLAGVVQGFIWPARGVLTSRFGWRWRRHHTGIDIAAPRGSPIAAARAGRVSFAGWYYGYGRTVIVDHGNGLQTVYGHASVLLVQAGQAVSAGQLIARVGSTGNATGPHLHFEVRMHGRAVNPLKYL